jgi:hypothetical protein
MEDAGDSAAVLHLRAQHLAPGASLIDRIIPADRPLTVADA